MREILTNMRDLNAYEDALELTDKLHNSAPSRGQRMDSLEDQAANALWRFMSSVFTKVEDDYAFKKELQEELRAKFGEMDAQTMILLYNRLNEHEIDAQRTAMYPFVPKEGKGGESTTVMDTLKSADEASPEQHLHESASPEVLRGLHQLHTLFSNLGSIESE